MRRTASVYAVNYTTCGLVSSKKMMKLMRKIPLLKKRLQARVDSYQDELFTDAVAILKNCFIFKTLEDDQALRKISYLLLEETYKEGDIILRQQEKSDFVYFIKEGTVEVTFQYYTNDTGGSKMPIEDILK